MIANNASDGIVYSTPVVPNTGVARAGQRWAAAASGIDRINAISTPCRVSTTCWLKYPRISGALSLTYAQENQGLSGAPDAAPARGPAVTAPPAMVMKRGYLSRTR